MFGIPKEYCLHCVQKNLTFIMLRVSINYNGKNQCCIIHLKLLLYLRYQEATDILYNITHFARLKISVSMVYLEEAQRLLKDLFCTLILPILLYGSETWASLKQELNLRYPTGVPTQPNY